MRHFTGSLARTGRFSSQRLHALSMDELVALQREVTADAQLGEGIHLYDKGTERKLNSIGWAIRAKLSSREVLS